MKRLKHDFKKGMAFVLSLAMVAGLVSAMSGGANKVQAAPVSGTEPSVSAYATKTQLTDGTFAPNAEGTADNYGKIVFGKKSDGTTAQEWYILGKDQDVSGDNTIIFAASPISTGQKFDSSTNDKDFKPSFGVYESEPSDVYPNHYGASELRAALQGMAANTDQFTTAEQGLMNATTVKTNDTKNSTTYTTTDKLYALQGNKDDDKLRAGTSDSTVLAMSSYWSKGSWFWLRSPHTDRDNALVAYSSHKVFNGKVDEERANQPDSNLNQPASNLKLSSVLFASAATAASSDPVKSGTIASGTAMTLRLDGTGKNIGTVTYNATTGDIKVDTSQPVSLVVQGKNEANDWYYSKQIAGPETVNASDIKSALSLTSDIDLSACKIWLEITDSTENVTYAIPATPNNTYQIIDGSNSSWTHDSDGNITIRGNGDFSKFSDVKVDGNLVDKNNYTVTEGSTIITLKASYLNTLSAGNHTVEILWTDGSANTTFTTKANTADNSNNNQNANNNSGSSDNSNNNQNANNNSSSSGNSNNNQNANNNSNSSDDKPSSGTDKKDVTAPKTGDNTPSVWLFILLILSGTGLIITVKKRRENLNS